jgi:hypothetical protein
MKRLFLIVFTAVLLGALAIFDLAASGPGKPVPYPDGYRNWTHVKSMVIQAGHPLYDSFGGIHHIYANGKALKAMQAGRTYPDGSVFVFDLLEVKMEDNAVTEGPRKVLGVMHKDAKAYRETGGWGFEGFKADTRVRVVKDMKKDCFACHEPQKETDFTFSSFRR